VRHALNPHTLRHLYDGLAGRYDVQHALITAGADGRGRRALVKAAVRSGDQVLDAGGGTGSTGLLAAERAGAAGRVVILDQSRGMLAAARRRAADRRYGRVWYVVADIHAPPFRPGTFDVVLSTYSMCPLVAPAEAAAALYDLIRPGGRLGVAHSTEPRGNLMRRVAARVEAWAWRRPGLSMGCRAVSVLPRLQELGAVVELDRRLGVPLWPFHAFVVRRPTRDEHPTRHSKQRTH
jgi:demethylmenaquinone methyltransferase / 2-methoxy-6-polyprenyl-1,4-benzoquinol methylase